MDKNLFIILFSGTRILVLPRQILIFIENVSFGLSVYRTRLKFSALLWILKFMKQQLALCLISPPSGSANNIVLCSTVGPPLLFAEKC